MRLRRRKQHFDAIASWNEFRAWNILSQLNESNIENYKTVGLEGLEF